MYSRDKQGQIYTYIQ